MPSAKNGQADSKVTNKIGPSSRAPKQGSRKTKKTATGINSAVLNADDKSNLAFQFNRGRNLVRNFTLPVSCFCYHFCTFDLKRRLAELLSLLVEK